jgi:hypothetical protein
MKKTPGGYNFIAISEQCGVTNDWLFLGKGQKKKCNISKFPDKISASISLLEVWIRLSDDPSMACDRAIIAVCDRCKDFEEWLKKQSGLSEKNGTDQSF